MREEKVLIYLKKVLDNMPNDWLKLTTHRLDIYHEELAKTEFLEHFETLFEADNADPAKLSELPTAFDYIRLGHPLSSILEWAIARLNGLSSDQVISFSSSTIPIMAIVRKNLFEKKNTQIVYTEGLPIGFDEASLRTVYGYNFELKKVNELHGAEDFDGSRVFISKGEKVSAIELPNAIDFYISNQGEFGSILLVNGDVNRDYIPEIQHVRRRETIAMTPANCYYALQEILGQKPAKIADTNLKAEKQQVIDSIKKITNTSDDALIGSSGLSVQYAIMMGLIDYSNNEYPGKEIKFIVPPNCYGGTNDQARRVAACVDHVEVVDLPVDGEHNMVQSIDRILAEVARQDAVPYIIAEIPTNPRVEVPSLDKLKAVLAAQRNTSAGAKAVDPVFILDQTFCPNVQFLGDEGILSSVRTISYVSGSKFPSGGKCTAGYCVANHEASGLLPVIQKHLQLCENEATDLQMHYLAEQMPSMNQRIEDAYKNTREFVNFIRENLEGAKINFVSEELAERGFTPSVCSLDLPTKGETEEEREIYKRALNKKLIDLMISEIPDESKYCVSYGQLKGCYWTIPATSTQGTTKEDDKDYIARVSLSPSMDLQKHKEVFLDFVCQI